MEGLERKSLPEGLCGYGISGVTPRLEPDGKDHKDWEGKEDGRELQQRVPCTRPRPDTHLAILAIPRLSGADGGERAPSYRRRRSTPERELPWGQEGNKHTHHEDCRCRRRRTLGKNDSPATFMQSRFSWLALGKHLVDRINFSIRDNTTGQEIPQASASDQDSYY